MSIETKLKEYILSRYKSLLEFTQSIEMPYGTMQSILKRGINNSSVTNIIKICNALEISADELGNGKIIPTGKALPKNTKITDIEKIIEFTKTNIQTYSDLTIDGEPLTENEMYVICDGLDLVVGLIKRNRERNKE